MKLKNDVIADVQAKLKENLIDSTSTRDVDSPNKTNTSVNGVQFKTADDSTAAVFPVSEDDALLLKAIKILLKRCKHKNGENALLDVIDNLCYYEDVFFGLPICENCKYAIMKNGEFEDCVKTLKQDAHYCRKVFLNLVKTGVIK